MKQDHLKFHFKNFHWKFGFPTVWTMYVLIPFEGITKTDSIRFQFTNFQGNSVFKRYGLYMFSYRLRTSQTDVAIERQEMSDRQTNEAKAEVRQDKLTTLAKRTKTDCRLTTLKPTTPTLTMISPLSSSILKNFWFCPFTVIVRS